MQNCTISFRLASLRHCPVGFPGFIITIARTCLTEDHIYSLHGHSGDQLRLRELLIEMHAESQVGSLMHDVNLYPELFLFPTNGI